MFIKIDELGTQARNYSRCFGVGDVSELAASMNLHGQITPILVDEDDNIVAGFRRVEAAKSLGWEMIKVQTYAGESPEAVNLVENLNRENISLWEEIQGIRDAFGAEASIADISRQLSKSTAWTRYRVRVWELDKEQINKVAIGVWGIKEIKQALAQKRNSSGSRKPPSVSGLPTPKDIKQLITWLYGVGRVQEAYALTYACGIITADQVKENRSEDSHIETQSESVDVQVSGEDNPTTTTESNRHNLENPDTTV
jgi:ParB family chromosome partitioning protein